MTTEPVVDETAAPKYPPADWQEERQHDPDDPLDCAMIMLPLPPHWQGEKTAEDKEELSRRAFALNEGMAMPFERKLDYALRVIERGIKQEGVKWAVSYSGGRDSTALSFLMVEVMGLKIPHVMSNTRMEYPETVRQAALWKQWLAGRGVELHTAFPDMRPGEVWAEGFPLWSKEIAGKVRKYAASKNPKHLARVPAELHPVVERVIAAGIKVTETCCDRLKKQPMAKWDKVNGIGGHFTGVRCEESQARRLMYIQRGSLYNSSLHGQWLGHPLTHWRREDVDSLLERHGVTVLRPGNGTGRSGCVTCGFGAHTENAKGRLNSLQELSRSNPKLLAAALDTWGYRAALDAAGIPYTIPPVA